MQATAIEIEKIVQIVLERLCAGAARPIGSPPATSSGSNVPVVGAHPSPVAVSPDELVLSGGVVSVTNLTDRLQGVKSVCVPERAVVTPAARDLLQQRNIKLRRATYESILQTASPADAPTANCRNRSLLVCGSAVWLSSLAKQLDDRVASVSVCEDGDAEALIARHLDAGGRGAIWITPAPYAATLKLNVTSRFGAVHLPTLSEFAQAMLETEAKLIVVGARTWSLAAVGNLVRTWSRSP